MQIFITGTDTNIGKTLVATWMCLHSGYSYFKPVQSGADRDTTFVSSFINEYNTYPEIYKFAQPVAPYLAAELSNQSIELQHIVLPSANNLIVEGAGGLMVPLNPKEYIVDLIKHLNLTTILVASSNLGTINHTLLSINLLRQYGIDCLGVILSGSLNPQNKLAIEHYGKIKVLAELPRLTTVTKEDLLRVPLSPALTQVLNHDFT